MFRGCGDWLVAVCAAGGLGVLAEVLVESDDVAESEELVVELLELGNPSGVVGRCRWWHGCWCRCGVVARAVGWSSWCW